MRFQKYINSSHQGASQKATSARHGQAKKSNRRQNSVEDATIYAQSEASGTTSREQRGAQLFTTQNDLELIVKNLLGQFTTGQRPDLVSHYASQQASKPVNNISFSKRKSAMLDLESVSSNLSGHLSSRVGTGQPLMMALDKDFLV